MKKLILFLLVQLVIINLSFSQSQFSILGKVGGQLLQNLSKNDEWRSIGKAIETAGDMTYEMEKINARNKEEITIRINPDNTKTIFPTEGYKWKYPKDNNNYNIEKVTNNDKELYYSAKDILKKSLIYFYKGNWDNAIIYCNESINKEETYLGYFLRSMCYGQKGMYNKALEDLGNTLNFDIENEDYRMIYLLKTDFLIGLQNYEETINVCNQCINTFSFSNHLLSSVLTNRGTAKYFLKQYNSALIDFNRCIELDSKNCYAFVNRGFVKSELNDNQGAIRDYTIAIDIYNSKQDLSALDKNLLSTAYANRGVVKYDEFDNYQGALQDANASLKWNDEYPQAYALRGISKIKLGFKESGCSDCYKAKKLGLSIDDLDVFKNNCVSVLQNINYNYFTDSRDRQTYKTVKIGNQEWMAENLNYNCNNSWCYDNNSSNCNKYGRIYTWEAAKNACPTGWHLPSDEEWKKMEMFLGMSQSDADNTEMRGTIGSKLKATSGWSNDGNGNNLSGFTALPGGIRDPDGTFSDLELFTFFWSNTVCNISSVLCRCLDNKTFHVYRQCFNKKSGFYVRCIKD